MEILFPIVAIVALAWTAYFTFGACRALSARAAIERRRR